MRAFLRTAVLIAVFAASVTFSSRISLSQESKKEPAGSVSGRVSNLAPGRYFLLVRAVSDEEFMERSPRPVAWDAASRTKLRREAEAANITVELQRCQRVADYSFKYTPPIGAKKPAPRTKL